MAERATVRVVGGVAVGASGADVARLYRELDLRLRRIVAFNVHAPETVIEDACQNAWLRFVDRRAPVPRPATLAWLVTTATREALRLLRRTERELPLETLLDPGATVPFSASPEQLVELRAQLEQVRSLPPRQQRLVWLQGLGLNYSEMAQATGTSRRTVERQILRARRNLWSA